MSTPSPGPVLDPFLVLLSFPLVASFIRSSGGSEVSPGGRWGAGSHPGACLSRADPDNFFWPIHPAGSAWLASASAAFWFRGADGDTEVAEGVLEEPGRPEK